MVPKSIMSINGKIKLTTNEKIDILANIEGSNYNVHQSESSAYYSQLEAALVHKLVYYFQILRSCPPYLLKL